MNCQLIKIKDRNEISIWWTSGHGDLSRKAASKRSYIKTSSRRYMSQRPRYPVSGKKGYSPIFFRVTQEIPNLRQVKREHWIDKGIPLGYQSMGLGASALGTELKSNITSGRDFVVSILVSINGGSLGTLVTILLLRRRYPVAL